MVVSFTLDDGITYAPSYLALVIPEEFNEGSVLVNHIELSYSDSFESRNRIVFTTLPQLDGNRYGFEVDVIGHNSDLGDVSKVTSIDFEQGIVYFSGPDSTIHSFLVREDFENVAKIRDWQVGDTVVMGLKTQNYSQNMPPACGRYPIVKSSGFSRNDNPWYSCTYNTLMNLSQRSQKPPLGCIDPVVN